MSLYSTNKEKTHIFIQLDPYGFNRQLELATFAADTIIIEKFPGISNCGFREFEPEKDAHFEDYCNEIFTIKCQNLDFVSKVTLRLSMVRLGANFPEMANVPYLKLIDQMKEFLNQFLGVVNQNIQEIYGMEFRIGIPSHLKLENSGDENIDVPGVRIIDTTGTFDINFGYVRINKDKEIDLKHEEFNIKCGQDAIEML